MRRCGDVRTLPVARPLPADAHTSGLRFFQAPFKAPLEVGAAVVPVFLFGSSFFHVGRLFFEALLKAKRALPTPHPTTTLLTFISHGHSGLQIPELLSCVETS